MFVVHFFENKNELVNQLLRQVPAEGDDVVIKGRKGKVTSVTNIDENHIHVQLFFEKLKVVNKGKAVVDTSKKKKR